MFPGVFAGSLPDTEPSEVATIADIVRTWKHHGGAVTIIVQNYGKSDWPRKDNAQSNKEELELLSCCLEVGAEVLFGKGFHSKFVVCPDIVISGSANMTYSGYYRNFEHVHVYRAQVAKAEYETERTACLNHLATAASMGQCVPPANLAGQLLSANLNVLRTFIQQP
jgi:phosphatidylserine/phosphatidylglycerophosphate/cardiolipin synthase-like enzyme